MGFALCSEALDIILKGMFPNAIESDTFQKPCGDNAIRVDVIAAQRNAGASKGGDCFACHVNSPNAPARQ